MPRICNSVCLRHNGAAHEKIAGKPMKKHSALAIAIGVAFVAAPSAHADNDWIAMAMSDSTGQIKFVDGGKSQGAAEQKAMEACRKAISDCRLLASGEGGCIALVLNAPKNKYVGGWGPTRDAAEAAALAAAGGGTVQPAHGHCLGDPVGSGGG